MVELAGRHPLPDAAALAAARAALDGLPAEARIILDGLGLPAFAPLADELVARRAVALIHHPTAMEAGIGADAAAALRATEAAMFPRLARLVVPSAATAAGPGGGIRRGAGADRRGGAGHRPGAAGAAARAGRALPSSRSAR